ncbi:hypothetical protein [Planctomonas deserti]|uniref:hypothetical protein n=1 Tax=Planctomonas deserti TaxID=2144185 RepID=UPI003F6813F9
MVAVPGMGAVPAVPVPVPAVPVPGVPMRGVGSVLVTPVGVVTVVLAVRHRVLGE